MRAIDLSSRLINPVYKEFLHSETRTQIFYGRASSGKSFFLAQRTVLDALQGRNYLVLRNVARTLRGSCWNEIVKAIDRMSVREWFNIGKSDMTITAVNNGAQIMFAGLDDVEKIKSITPATGVLTDIWIEEATEVGYDDYKQLLKRLRGESRHSKRITLSFNPVYKSHWIFQEFFVTKPDSVSILKTTYRDNKFLTDDDRNALETETNEYYKQVYTEGEWGVIGGVVFRNWRIGSYELDKRDLLLIGLDFGYINDPSAMVVSWLRESTKELFIVEEWYQKSKLNDEIAGMIKYKGFAKEVIIADSAEAKSIEEIRREGIPRIRPAAKGQGSVMQGIQKLHQYKIYVSPQCENVVMELENYSWKKDKSSGEYLNEPQDDFNHCIDALRYSLQCVDKRQRLQTMDKAALGL